TPAPTNTLAPTETPTFNLFITNTPLFVTNTPLASLTQPSAYMPLASLTPTTAFTLPPTQPSFNSPTPGSALHASGTPPPPWTPPPPDPSVQIADHYHFRRPIADGSINYGDRTYPYGGTSGGKLQVHHGLDMVNPSGTPILAAGDGVVYYAG